MRRVAAVLIALASVVLASGCGGGSPSTKGIGPKELERDIALQNAAVSGVHCGSGENGWTYLCHLAYTDGKRTKVGFQVSGASVDRRSEEVSENASLAALRTPPTGAYANTASGIEGACLEMNNELHDVAQPRTKAEFEKYVRKLSRIARDYRRKLEALNPVFRPGDRAIFTRYLRMLRTDDHLALAVRDAVLRSDRPALLRLVQRQRARDAAEHALLSRLGATCP
jgi:hypothetical protein